MLNNIGLHVIGSTALPLTNGNAKPAIIKLLDPTIAYYRTVRTEVGLDCLIDIRFYQATQPLDNPKANATNWFNDHVAFIQAAKSATTIFEGYNEIPDSQAMPFSIFEIERGRWIHSIGANVGYLSESVGCADFPIWAIYQPVLDAMLPGDYVCLHEYWIDNADIDNRYHCGRWTKVPQLAGKKIAITECGRDRIENQGQPGWQRTTDNAGFKADLRKYSALMAQYPHVRGATVFQDGSSDPQWQAFGVAPIWRDIVAEYTISAPVTPPIATFAFDGRQMNQVDFKAYAESLNLSGTYDKVIIHHTANPDEALWDKWGGWDYWKNSMRETYIGYGWDAGPHCYVDQVGIGLFTPLDQDGIGVTDNNHRTRHIEIVGNFTNRLPDGQRLANAVWCAAVLLISGGLGIDRLTFHKAVKDETSCPGADLISAWGWFVSLVNAKRIELNQPPLPDPILVEANKYVFPVNQNAALCRYGFSHGWSLDSIEFAFDGYTYEWFFDPVHNKRILCRCQAPTWAVSEYATVDN